MNSQFLIPIPSPQNAVIVPDLIDEALRGIDINPIDQFLHAPASIPDYAYPACDFFNTGVKENFLASSERYRISRRSDGQFEIKYRMDGSEFEEIMKPLIPGILPRMPLNFIKTMIPTRTVTYFELSSDTFFEDLTVNVLIDMRSPSSFINSFLLRDDHLVYRLNSPQNFRVQWGSDKDFECEFKSLIKIKGKMGSIFYMDAFVITPEKCQNERKPFILLGLDFLEKYLKAIQNSEGIKFYYFEDNHGLIHKSEYYLVSDSFIGA